LKPFSFIVNEVPVPVPSGILNFIPFLSGVGIFISAPNTA